MAQIDLGKNLIAMDLATLLAEIGKAAISANSGNVEFTIPEAEIELKVALHISQQTQAGGGVQAGIYGIALNASYQASYGYTADAASTIRVKFTARPK